MASFGGLRAKRVVEGASLGGVTEQGLHCGGVATRRCCGVLLHCSAVVAGVGLGGARAATRRAVACGGTCCSGVDSLRLRVVALSVALEAGAAAGAHDEWRPGRRPGAWPVLLQASLVVQASGAGDGRRQCGARRIMGSNAEIWRGRVALGLWLRTEAP